MFSMNNDKWDSYFHSHYKPVNKEWSKEDLHKYKKWYRTWIPYVANKSKISFKNKSVLELGCGIGAVSSLLSEQGAVITGSDVARNMIKSASRLNPHIPYVYYDVMNPFTEKKHFDVVIAFEVLEHVSNLKKAMKNIYDVLSPNGIFIGTTPYPYKKNMKDPTHVNVHKPEFWKLLFTQNKFVTKVSPMSFSPFLWRLPLSQNVVIPFRVSFPYFVSTTLIIACKQ